MTREQAHRAAVAKLGNGAIVGINDQYREKPYFVGVRNHGDFVKFGAGASWEEALEAVRPVRDLGNGRFKEI